MAKVNYAEGDTPQKPQGKRQSRFKGATKEGLSKVVPLTPMNDNQKKYIKALDTGHLVLAAGSSGTGKTYVATIVAANKYLKGEIDKIILTRPNVSVGKSLGYLKGTMEEKFTPWLHPILDTLKEVLGSGKVDTDVKNGKIKFAPIEYMRGSSFSDCFLIADELQNLTISEIKMLLTRMGENSTLVLCGDIKQSDLKEKENNGLSFVIDTAKKHGIDVDIIEFTIDDVVRSDMCKQWLIAFDAEGV